jgi:hypothetical protein
MKPLKRFRRDTAPRHTLLKQGVNEISTVWRQNTGEKFTHRATQGIGMPHFENQIAPFLGGHDNISTRLATILLSLFAPPALFRG